MMVLSWCEMSSGEAYSTVSSTTYIVHHSSFYNVSVDFCLQIICSKESAPVPVAGADDPGDAIHIAASTQC